jgi:hypothetical protein
VLLKILKSRRDRIRLEEINQRYFEFARNRALGFGEKSQAVNPENAFGFSRKLNPRPRCLFLFHFNFMIILHLNEDYLQHYFILLGSYFDRMQDLTCY